MLEHENILNIFDHCISFLWQPYRNRGDHAFCSSHLFSFPFFPVEIDDYVDISEDLDTVRYLSLFVFKPSILRYVERAHVCACVHVHT